MKRGRLQHLSRGQRLLIMFLFAVLMVIGKHDVTASLSTNLAMHFSPDELGANVAAGSPERQMAFVALLIGGLILMARSRIRGILFDVLSDNLPLSCFVALTLLSILWSTDPTFTARRSVEYLVLCLAAAAAGRALGMSGVIWLGFLSSTGYLIIGVLAEIILGTFAPFHSDYRFYGTLYPNEQAWNCVLLLLCGSALVGTLAGLRRAALWVAMILGSLCLVLTKSRTSLICGLVAVGFYWSGRLSRRRKLALGLAVAGAAGVALVAILVVPSVASHLNVMLLAGRDVDSYDSLSGRIPLWKLCIDYVSTRPLLGYGFDSFWTPDHIRTISAQEGWAVPAAHDGFIDLMLGIGSLGLAIYLFQLLGTWRILHAWNTRGPLVRFYAALLLFYFTCMFTETIAFAVGLPTFCVLCLLWSRRHWSAEANALNRAALVTGSRAPATPRAAGVVA